MSKTPTVKILVAYHKPSYLLKSDVFVPIHVGRAVAFKHSKDGKISNDEMEWLQKNTIGDDTGENISNKNRMYCELTALYWAWKNYDKLGNPDYIGLMQYRRHFIFNEFDFNGHKLSDIENCYSMYELNYAPKNYKDLIGIDDTTIKNILTKYDYVSARESDFSLIGIANVRADYTERVEGTKTKDYDLMADLVINEYPHLRKYIENQRNKPYKYLYQMFILPQKVFFEYMEFLFSILFKIEQKIDFSDYSINGQRTLGYLGELLFDCYFHYLKNESSLNKKEFFVTMLKDTTPCEFSKSKRKKYINKLFKLYLYRCLYIFSWGELHKNYKEKYKKTKQYIKQNKNIIYRGKIICN